MKGKDMPGRMVAEKDGSIGWMIFDHPERRNAVTQAMWLQIGEILEGFAKDGAIRIVVLRGAGDKAFVSGADISQFGQQRRNAVEVEASNRLTEAARQALATFAKPTSTAISPWFNARSKHVLTAPIIRRVVRRSWKSVLHALPDAEVVKKANLHFEQSCGPIHSTVEGAA